MPGSRGKSFTYGMITTHMLLAPRHAGTPAASGVHGNPIRRVYEDLGKEMDRFGRDMDEAGKILLSPRKWGTELDHMGRALGKNLDKLVGDSVKLVKRLDQRLWVASMKVHAALVKRKERRAASELASANRMTDSNQA